MDEICEQVKWMKIEKIKVNIFYIHKGWCYFFRGFNRRTLRNRVLNTHRRWRERLKGSDVDCMWQGKQWDVPSSVNYRGLVANNVYSVFSVNNLKEFLLWAPSCVSGRCALNKPVGTVTDMQRDRNASIYEHNNCCNSDSPVSGAFHSIQNVYKFLSN